MRQAKEVEGIRRVGIASVGGRYIARVFNDSKRNKWSKKADRAFHVLSLLVLAEPASRRVELTVHEVAGTWLDKHLCRRSMYMYLYARLRGCMFSFSRRERPNQSPRASGGERPKQAIMGLAPTTLHRLE
jgi:hypothetical protein